MHTMQTRHCVMLVMAAYLSILTLISCSPAKDNPQLIADAFAKALMENDAETAKAFSSPDNWQRIDDWIRSHTPFKCPGLDWDSGASGGGFFTEGTRLWTEHVSISCVDQGRIYCFELENIRIQLKDDEWQVQDWEVVCEVHDYCDVCPRTP